MKTEFKQPKVGDTMYYNRANYGYRTATIERETPTTFVMSDGNKLRKPIKDSNYPLGSRDTWYPIRYFLPTPKIEQEFKMQELRSKASNLILNIKVSQLTEVQLNKVITALNTASHE